MKKIEISRAANDALEFDETMKQEFGSGLRLPHVPLGGSEVVSVDFEGAITITNEFEAEGGRPAYGASYTVIPASRNITEFKPNTGYGLMTADGVVPAIISPRSTPSELHVLYLHGETIIPGHVGKVGYEPTDLQRSALQGVNPFQARSVGSEKADSQAGTASEGGHSMLGLKSLTDRRVKEAVFNRQHIVHGLAEKPKGIMPVFAQPGTEGGGMLSVAGRPLIPDEEIITPASGGAYLIDHPYYRSIGTEIKGLEASPELIVMGIGIEAAKSQLNYDDDQLRESLLTTMDKI